MNYHDYTIHLLMIFFLCFVAAVCVFFVKNKELSKKITILLGVTAVILLCGSTGCSRLKEKPSPEYSDSPEKATEKPVETEESVATEDVSVTCRETEAVEPTYPFESLSIQNVQQISVETSTPHPQNYRGPVFVPDNQMEKMLEILRGVIVFGKNEKWYEGEVEVGGSQTIIIYKTDGTSIVYETTVKGYSIIDGMGYEYDYESRQKVTRMVARILGYEDAYSWWDVEID